MRNNRLRIDIKKVVFVFFLSLLISTLLFVFVVGFSSYVYRSDFVSFVSGAKIVSGGRGTDLYDLQLQQRNQSIVTSPNNHMALLPYRNPPVLALFFIPLTFLPLVDAYKIYTLILVVATVVLMWISSRIFENLRESYWLLLPFLFYPGIVAIFAGQVSIFILLFYMLIFYFLKREKALLMGVITGLLLFKPQYIISLPFIIILVENKKRFIKGLSITLFFLFAGSILISGTEFIGDYFKMLIQTENLIGEVKTSMFTIFYTLSQTALQKHYIFLINISVYLMAIYFFYRIYKQLSLGINYSLAILLTLVFCIHGVIVDMVIILLPIWILLDNFKTNREVDTTNAFAIFILVLSPLGYILKVPYMISFLFLFSVALLTWKTSLQSTEK